MTDIWFIYEESFGVKRNSKYDKLQPSSGQSQTQQRTIFLLFFLLILTFILDKYLQ